MLYSVSAQTVLLVHLSLGIVVMACTCCLRRSWQSGDPRKAAQCHSVPAPFACLEGDWRHQHLGSERPAVRRVSESVNPMDGGAGRGPAAGAVLQKAVPGGAAMRAPVPEAVPPAALPLGRRRLRGGVRPPNTRHRACTSDSCALAACSSSSADGIMRHISEAVIAGHTSLPAAANALP